MSPSTLASHGSQLHDAWRTSLNDAETKFRNLISSNSTSDWKRISISSDDAPSTPRKGRPRTQHGPAASDVLVHRNIRSTGDDIYRLILDIPTLDEPVTLEPWKLVLSTPEMRQEWDPAVQGSSLLELLDADIRICKTDFTIGWPARDAVTISRIVQDATTVIDISTSLPRSPDEPAYLRPSPPFVRSNVSLLAWWIQYSHSPSSLPNNSPTRRPTGRIRVTCFWQHDLRAAWNFATAGFVQQLCTMMVGLSKSVSKRATRIPRLIGFGHGISLERVQFTIDRDALLLRYSLIPEDDILTSTHEQLHNIDELHALKEKRRLARAIECTLPSIEGWDVQISQTGSSSTVENLPWSTYATQHSSFPSPLESPLPQDQILLKIVHSPLPSDHDVLKVTVILERSGPSSGWRLNGIPQAIHQADDRDPVSYHTSQNVLPDVSSVIVGGSVDSASSISIRTTMSEASSLSSTSKIVPGERTPAVEKSILSRVRRNYIYFSSLLQEPDAKWKRTTEARGVSVTQLDSIDPTLVVYKAEATFVGVGLWDLYGVVSSPGARTFWDKQHEDATLLEDVSDLTELWHVKSKPAWPSNARDAVLLKTVYKSPTSIHVFFFSSEDSHIFPNIPPADPNIIRAQVDLQGWVIDALSPTTTQLTLLEQSDPKGWSNKASIPTQMINSLAGIGDFAIKLGGPPVVTRLGGAKASDIRYDHERLSFRFEYEPSSERLTHDPTSEGTHEVPTIECQIRCDIDTWASSLDIVVDPPPQSVSCLRRHKLSETGGGLWLTITHDSIFVDDERLLVIIRRGLGKEKGLVMVNGVKVPVDFQELPEAEIKMLSKRKRAKPLRIPLDQPPVMGAIRRRREEWDADSESRSSVASSHKKRQDRTTPTNTNKRSSTLSRFWTLTMGSATDSTQSALSAISLAAALEDPVPLSPTKPPLQQVLDALAWTQDVHSRFRSDGWAVVGEKDILLHRKLCPEISPVVPVHKGEKVIEGVAAEEVASVLSSWACRKSWDDRYDRSRILHSFGANCQSNFLSSKANFPFRDRGFFIASIVARANLGAAIASSRDSISTSSPSPVYLVSTSFHPDFVKMFDSAKYNPSNMPIGRVFVDAWILETLDPYTKENYTVPSTRCTRLVAVDYAGSIPVAVNNMISASLPRQILPLEQFIKGSLPAPLPVIRTPSSGLSLATIPHEDPEYEGEHVWKFRRKDDQRTILSYHFSPDQKIGQGLMVFSFSSHRHSRDTTIKDTTPRPSQITPDPKRREATSPDRRSIDSTSSADLSQMADSTASIASDATLTGLPTVERARTPSPTRVSGLPSSPPSSPSHVVIGPSRQRTQSAAPSFKEPMLSPRSPSHSRLSSRTSNAAMSLKATPIKDTVVVEVVIDSSMYFDQDGYLVRVRSWQIDESSGSQEEEALLSLPRTLSVAHHQEGEVECVLPLQFAMYTVPSSQLYSLTSENDLSSRHMLRATLSTAKYDIQTLEDPLTGKMQRAPERPDWLLHLDAGGRIGIAVEICPRKSVDPKVNGLDNKGTRRIRKRSRPTTAVSINGQDVKILDEKQSLSALGREELLPPDEGMARWGVVTRLPASSTSTFPPELVAPIGVAKDLLLDLSPPLSDFSKPSTPGMETPGLETASESMASSVVDSEEQGNSSGDPSSTLLNGTSRPSTSWMDYLSPRNFAIGAWMPRDGKGAASGTIVAESSSVSLVAPKEPSLLDADGSDGKVSSSVQGGRLTRKSSEEGPSNSRRTRTRRRQESTSPRLHRTETLIAIALVAFLIGSLMRGLVAPVDYVFVPSTSKQNHAPPEMEETNGRRHPLGGQWREMKRLGEFKIKGWDLVIGAVRHHRV